MKGLIQECRCQGRDEKTKEMRRKRRSEMRYPGAVESAEVPLRAIQEFAGG